MAVRTGRGTAQTSAALPRAGHATWAGQSATKSCEVRPRAPAIQSAFVGPALGRGAYWESWAAMHQKGSHLRGGPRLEISAWRRLPRQLGAVTVSYNCH